MNPNLKQIVDNIASKNLGDNKDILERAISEKATDVLEMRKVAIAKNYFGQPNQE